MPRTAEASAVNQKCTIVNIGTCNAAQDLGGLDGFQASDGLLATRLGRGAILT